MPALVAIAPPAVRITALLNDSRINSTRNDYAAYGRRWDPTFPAPLYGQQYKLGKAEALAMVSRIAGKPQAKAMLKELKARTLLDTPKGSVALTSFAAKVLNDYSKDIGAGVKFTSGQKPPRHPVG